MYNVVKIGDKAVPFLSMASVDRYFKNIFGDDPIKMQAKGLDEAEAIDFITRMGFVMAKFAEITNKKEMAKLNEGDFLEWLDQFERNEFFLALPDIQKTYEGQLVTEADAKKNNEELTEK